MKNQNPILHTPEGVRDIYGSEFVQKFELQQLLGGRCFHQPFPAGDGV